MPVFPSAEWMRAFCANLQRHPNIGQVAAALDGVYRFVVEPSGPVTSRHVYHVRIARGSAGDTVTHEPEFDGAAVTLTLAADYRRWQQLLRGELDLTSAVLLRRLRLSGDVGRLRSRLASAEPLREALMSVDTQWPPG
jgi:hypothetical protein